MSTTCQLRSPSEIIFICVQIGRSNPGREIRTEFLWGNLKERPIGSSWY